jgi:hypothetical protein
MTNLFSLKERIIRFHARIFHHRASPGFPRDKQINKHLRRSAPKGSFSHGGEMK